MELILQKCTPQQLGMLETTCSFFYKTGIAERVALTQLKAIPRAKGLRPNKKCACFFYLNHALPIILQRFMRFVLIWLRCTRCTRCYSH